MRIPCGLATCACIYIQAATLQPRKIARCARAFSGNPVGAPPIQAHVATNEPTEKHKNNRAPKKYRRTFWEEETERSNRGGLRKQIARKAQFTATRSGAFALNRLRTAPRIPPRGSRFSLRVSVRFRHLCYRFFAHLSHVFALVPAAERVREDELSPVFPIGADDIVFHDVGYEVLR